MAEKSGEKPKITDVVNELQTNLGERLTAVIAGVKDVKLVHEWSEGIRVPGRSNEGRLRLAHGISMQMIAASESPETVRSWFIGTDPFLEDSAPAIVIANANRRNIKEIEGKISKAARVFLAE